MAKSITTTGGAKTKFRPLQTIKRGWKAYKKWASNKVSTVEKALTKAKRQRLANQTRKLKREQQTLAQKLKNNQLRSQNQAIKDKARIEATKVKATLQQTKLDANARKGGPTGYFARRRKRIIAENEAKIKQAEMEPELSAAERRTKMNTEAKVKTTQAKGAAVATVASAIGGGYASKAVSDNAARIKEAEAEIETSKAMVASLNKVPDYTTDEYSGGKSVSGLQTGTRE